MCLVKTAPAVVVPAADPSGVAQCGCSSNKVMVAHNCRLMDMWLEFGSIATAAPGLLRFAARLRFSVNGLLSSWGRKAESCKMSPRLGIFSIQSTVCGVSPQR
jgi:hypothetical protein